MTFVRTIGTGALWVFSGVMLQLAVPDKYRGRVFAFEFATLTLTQSVSILGAGIAGQLGLVGAANNGRLWRLGILIAACWFLFILGSRRSARLADLAGGQNVGS
jgi:hypothetical protein